MSVTLDTLAFDSDLLIQREIDLPVSLNLCARPGIGLADVQHGRVVPARARAVPRAGSAQQAARRPSFARRQLHLRRGARGRRSRSAPIMAAICNALAAELYGLDVLATDDRGPSREPDPLRARRARRSRRRPVTTRRRSCASSAQDRPGFAARDPPGVRGAGDQPHEARVAADEAQPRRLLLLHRLRRPHRRRARRRRAAQPRGEAGRGEVPRLVSGRRAGEAACIGGARPSARRGRRATAWVDELRGQIRERTDST